MKVIQTEYRGYMFRSRLEARWAVYFDALGFPWVYEPEGFVLDDGTMYLPDFWLPQVNMWAEVKPVAFTEQEKAKARSLAIESGFPCLMLVGVPDAKPYWAMKPAPVRTERTPDPFWDSIEFEPAGEFEDEPDEIDYALSNYKNYPQAEHRFFVNLRFCGQHFTEMFGDVVPAVIAAQSARFEYGDRKVGL